MNYSGHNHGGKTINHSATACLSFWTAMEEQWRSKAKESKLYQALATHAKL